MTKYVLPRPERLSLSETLVQSLSKDNYRLWMHEMLYLEEMAELGFIQRLVSRRRNKFQLMSCVWLMGHGEICYAVPRGNGRAWLHSAVGVKKEK